MKIQTIVYIAWFFLAIWYFIDRRPAEGLTCLVMAQLIKMENK